MPAVSAADRSGLCTLGGRGSRLAGKAQMVAVTIGGNAVAGEVPPLQHREGKGVLQQPLDGPLERSSAVDRVVASIGQEFPGRWRERQGQAPLGQQLVQAPQLEIHDPVNIGTGERPEDHDVVDPVQEFGSEMAAKFGPNPVCGCCNRPPLT